MNQAVWFLVALSLLQVGAFVSLLVDGKPSLAGVYLCYGVANFLTIFVVGQMK
mgnify:FL=1